MILLVNGDSHTAGAEAVNQYSFAYDDPRYVYMGRAPHPNNIDVSWGKKLGKQLKSHFHILAESASSNTRIIRTTREFLKNHPGRSEIVIIIGWSTWEREEWLINGGYFQVNASGIDDVPENYRDKYKHYIASVSWPKVTKQAHEEIWEFHLELDALGIKHIFFNGNTDFSEITEQKAWGTSYIGPYDPQLTYTNYLNSLGIRTVAADSYHFGEDGHSAWAKYILSYIVDNKIV